MILPWTGLATGIAGVVLAARGDALGWLLIVLGIAQILLDLAIDFWWASPMTTRSEEPDLNQRAAQHVGRTGIVVEPFIGGRGRIRIDDTLWPAVGGPAPVGASVRVTGVADTQAGVLAVEPLAP